jgi:hypothetical protein
VVVAEAVVAEVGFWVCDFGRETDRRGPVAGGERGGVNLLCIVGNNPIHLIDYLGKIPIPVIKVVTDCMRTVGEAFLKKTALEFFEKTRICHSIKNDAFRNLNSDYGVHGFQTKLVYDHEKLIEVLMTCAVKKLAKSSAKNKHAKKLLGKAIDDVEKVIPQLNFTENTTIAYRCVNGRVRYSVLTTLELSENEFKIYIFQDKLSGYCNQSVLGN